jgi:hypothetical protein
VTEQSFKNPEQACSNHLTETRAIGFTEQSNAKANLSTKDGASNPRQTEKRRNDGRISAMETRL